MQMLLSVGTFLEIFLTFAIFVALVVNLLLTGEPFGYEGSPLTYNPNVKAALFALASAALLAISWLPTGQTQLGDAALWFNRVTTMITANLTGWYWLVGSTTHGDPQKHLVFVIILSSIIVVGIVIYAYVALFGFALLTVIFRWLRRKFP